MKEKLANQETELRDRNEKTEKLLKNVGKQTEKVAKEKEVADEEEKKVEKVLRFLKYQQKTVLGFKNCFRSSWKAENLWNWIKQSWTCIESCNWSSQHFK